MAEERLEPKDLKVLLLWLLVGLVGAGCAWKYFFVAFPEAAVDFRVSRPAALEQARNYLGALGERIEGYRSTIIFDADDTAKTYLERELGLEQANRLMAAQVSVWYWEARFFRSGQKEEFSVEVSPAGRIVGMTHTIEENRAGARLDQNAARVLAEKFLLERVAIDLPSYDFLAEEANPTERPNRRDWSFSWERRGFKAKDAPYRLRVSVQGDQVGGYQQFLKVPEAWQRDFQRLRSSNDLYQNVAQVPFAFLFGAVIVVLFELGRRGILRWAGALKLAAVLGALFFLKAVNEWPLTLADYNTNSTLGGFFLSQMGAAVLLSVATGLSVALTVAAGEPIYRNDFPGKLRLGAMFRVEGIRSKSFFRSCVIGLAMAAAHIGFVAVFYVVGKRFGFWVPQEVKYTDTVSTVVPWISPLSIALYAATNEEFLFRLFAIPYLLRLTKSRVVAVVVPAFIWGFLHSAYQVEPGYARGLEVGLIGIVAGWVLLRWGILTTLVWHYTVDALLIGLFLLRSQSFYFRFSGALVALFVLIPLAVAGLALIVRGRFAPEEPLLNRAEPVIATAVEVAQAPRLAEGYQACSPRTLKIGVAAGVLGLLLVIFVKPQAIGDYVRLQVDAKQAIQNADQVLRRRGVDPARYKHSATFDGNYKDSVNEYLREQVGIPGANRIYQQEVPSAFWKVRYFRDSEKEEYLVVLAPDGSLHSVHHLLDEKTSGASLTKAQAEEKAAAFLRDAKHVDLSKWNLVQADSQKRPERTDHTFVWEEKKAIGDAHVRKQVEVLGDEAEGYRVFIHVPEEWERQRSEETLSRSACKLARIGFFIALGVLLLVLFFKNLRQPAGAAVPWSRLARWAVWAAVGIALVFATSYQAALMQYDTEWPFHTFLAILLIGLFLGVAVIFSALYFLLGLAWYFLNRAFGEGALPGWLGMPVAYYRDAFWLGLVGTALLLGVGRLPELLSRIWPALSRSLEASLPRSVSSWLPAMNIVSAAVPAAFFYLGLLGLAAGFLAAYLRPWWQKAAFLFVVACAWAGSWAGPADFAEHLLLRAIVFAIFWWAVARVWRLNLLAYFLSVLGTVLIANAVELLQQPNRFYRLNGCAVLAALLALFLWPLVAGRGRAQVPAGSGAAEAGPFQTGPGATPL